ncbi:hypothetical protein ACFFJ7_12085 [Pseudochelatococcus lubricantis]|uniref:tetratricopeptide repeat protein n=1 Tax=Pseudochelatococcus lubricantis TaxID=1538102 RepID=UPI0035EB761F
MNATAPFSGGGIRLLVLAAAGAALFAGVPAPRAQQAEPRETTTSAQAFLRTPPKRDYAKVCRKIPRPQPPAVDWTKWDGRDTTVPPERMLADAGRYAAGGADVARDRALARRMLDHLAARSTVATPEAKRQLALSLTDPAAGPVDLKRAETLLQEASAALRTGAALTLGRLYRTGALPAPDPDAAARYLGIAASQGDPAAALQLAALYATPGAAQPFDNAARHFLTLAVIGVQTALAGGDCSVLTDVGDFLLGVEGDAGAAAAARWYEVGAGVGDADAAARLASLHETGRGLPKDTAKALELWELAARQGSVRAMTAAARLHLAAGRDTPSAQQLLSRAVLAQEPDALLLAVRYHRGDFTGKADPVALAASLDKAAAAPSPAVEALSAQAFAYRTGRGVTADEARAGAIYERLGAMGSPEADVAYADYLLDQGLDLREAAARLTRAAGAGQPAALYTLSEIGRCVPGAASPEEAASLLARAANAGNAAALRRLARSAADAGDGAAARGWLGKAAALGDRRAMVELAVLIGGGVAQEEAVRFAARAAAPGDGVVPGRLALADAYFAARLPSKPGDGDRLLATVAESGNGDVDLRLAKRLLAHTPVDDAARAQAIGRLAAAAGAGNGEAMLALYRLGEGVADKTGVPAGEWLLRAAERGEADALAALPDDEAAVRRVLAGVGQRIVCDPRALALAAGLYARFPDGGAARAEALLRQAERIAAERPRQLFGLGELYASGAATGAPDTARAIGLFERAAAAGHPKAATLLGDLHANQHGAEAAKWYRLGALAGQPAAVRGLVVLAGRDASDASETALAALREAAGNGVPSALNAYGTLLLTLQPERGQEGVALLTQAAETGDVTAMKSLARLYAAGLNGGRVSADEATRWTRRAAEAGDPEAMYQYGLALDLGFGVKADRQSAMRWQKRAHDNGYIR